MGRTRAVTDQQVTKTRALVCRGVSVLFAFAALPLGLSLLANYLTVLYVRPEVRRVIQDTLDVADYRQTAKQLDSAVARISKCLNAVTPKGEPARNVAWPVVEGVRGLYYDMKRVSSLADFDKIGSASGLDAYVSKDTPGLQGVYAIKNRLDTLTAAVNQMDQRLSIYANLDVPAVTQQLQDVLNELKTTNGLLRQRMETMQKMSERFSE